MGSVLGVAPSSFLEVPACHVGGGGGISPVAVSLPQPSLPIEFLPAACLAPDGLTTIYLVLLSSFWFSQLADFSAHTLAAQSTVYFISHFV